MAPNLTGVGGRGTEVPCLELVVNRNVEHEGDHVPCCDRDSRAQEDLEFSAITSSAQNNQPQDRRRHGDRRERWQRTQIIDVNDLLELNEAGGAHRRASEGRSQPISKKQPCHETRTENRDYRSYSFHALLF